MTLAEAMARAALLKSWLEDSCTRIEIAGSVRRRTDEVKDIEIVCVPKLATNLFGEVDLDQPHAVKARLESIGITPRLNKNGHRIGWGQRFLAGVWEERDDCPLDVFCVLPPAQWGAILAIRTGPAEYSKWLVTEALKRGLRCVDGRLTRLDPTDIFNPDAGFNRDIRRLSVETPEEEDFFRELGVDWVPPHERRVP